MPVFECTIRGDDKPRLVRASSGAQARAHIVEAKPVKAERLADLLDGGATLEKATVAEPAPEPKPEAKPQTEGRPVAEKGVPKGSGGEE
jgi:hypothetical protein